MAENARIQEEDINAPALEDGSLERIVMQVERLCLKHHLDSDGLLI